MYGCKILGAHAPRETHRFNSPFGQLNGAHIAEKDMLVNGVRDSLITLATDKNDKWLMAYVHVVWVCLLSDIIRNTRNKWSIEGSKKWAAQNNNEDISVFGGCTGRNECNRNSVTHTAHFRRYVTHIGPLKWRNGRIESGKCGIWVSESVLPFHRKRLLEL